MKRYRVIDRYSGQCETVTANSAQEACGQMGWMIGDCYVKELPPERNPDMLDGETPIGLSLGGYDGD